MYVFNQSPKEKEILHTTNFKDLEKLYIMLDNETSPTIIKSGNTNY